MNNSNSTDLLFVILKSFVIINYLTFQESGVHVSAPVKTIRKRPIKKPKPASSYSSNVFKNFLNAFSSRIPNHLAPLPKKQYQRKPIAIPVKQKPAVKPQRGYGRPSKERRHKRPGKQVIGRYQRPRPKMDERSDTFNTDERASLEYPSYVSVEQ